VFIAVAKLVDHREKLAGFLDDIPTQATVRLAEEPGRSIDDGMHNGVAKVEDERLVLIGPVAEKADRLVRVETAETAHIVGHSGRLVVGVEVDLARVDVPKRTEVGIESL